MNDTYRRCSRPNTYKSWDLLPWKQSKISSVATLIGTASWTPVAWSESLYISETTHSGAKYKKHHWEAVLQMEKKKSCPWEENIKTGLILQTTKQHDQTTVLCNRVEQKSISDPWGGFIITAGDHMGLAKNKNLTPRTLAETVRQATTFLFSWYRCSY